MNTTTEITLYSLAAGLSAFCFGLYVLSVYADYLRQHYR